MRRERELRRRRRRHGSSQKSQTLSKPRPAARGREEKDIAAARSRPLALRGAPRYVAGATTGSSLPASGWLVAVVVDIDPQLRGDGTRKLRGDVGAARAERAMIALS
jgi:hypothetical protein